MPIAIFRSLAAAIAIAACAAAFAQPAPVGPRPGVAWLIYVDDLHLDFRNTGRYRAMLRTIATELIRDGDMVAIGSSGPSRVAFPLTSDRSALDSAIKWVTGNGLKTADILGMRRTPADDEVAYRLRMALSGADGMLLNLEPARDRAKALIYISNGYIDDERLGDGVAALAKQAREASVRIFAIDPRTLAPIASDQDPIDAGYLAATRDSLRRLSEPTGGFALLDHQDLVDSLKRISSAMR